jgi:DNA-binding NarL/FixJ family response regulator
MTSAKNIRILIVDDHAMFRQVVRSVLKPYPNIEVVGEASDGDEAVVGAGQLKPAIVLMDINMQRMDGVTAARLIRAQYPEVAILGLSAKAKHYDIYAMQRAGAFEVLSKEQSVHELYAAIQRAVAAVQPVLIMEETPQQAFAESEASETNESTSMSQPVEQPKTGQEEDS